MTISTKDLCIGILLIVAWSCTGYMGWQLHLDGTTFWSNPNLTSDTRELMDLFILCFTVGVAGLLLSEYPRFFGVMTIVSALPFIYMWFAYMRK